MIKRLFEIMTPQKVLNSDDETILHLVRKGYLRMLIVIPIAFLILFYLTYNLGFAPAHKFGEWGLSGWELIFICPTVLMEILGIIWFRIIGWEKRDNKTALDLWNVEFVRLIMISSGPVCGFILRFTGSGWHVVSSLFVLTILALIITFPTKNKINQWHLIQCTPDLR